MWSGPPFFCPGVWTIRQGTFSGDRGEEIPRGLNLTYRFPDGVRVMVWAYNLVVWVYPDSRQVHSEKVGPMAEFV